jgi:hypothetical protein
MLGAEEKQRGGGGLSLGFWCRVEARRRGGLVGVGVQGCGGCETIWLGAH